MLSGYDDYPIHQAPVPVAETSGSDINFYDRYFFNGYEHDGSLYFGVAMGLYPNRHVADAAFSIVHDGQQLSVWVRDVLRRAARDRIREAGQPDPFASK